MGHLMLGVGPAPPVAAFVHDAPPSQLELAAPFLIMALIILVSVFIIHEVILKLEAYLAGDWTEAELLRIDADRAPSTHALAALWAIDAAQIPAIIGAPAASLFILRKAYTTGFLVIYTTVLAGGLIFFFVFLRQVKIQAYPGRGCELLGVRFSPLAIGGIALNLAGAGSAAFLIR